MINFIKKYAIYFSVFILLLIATFIRYIYQKDEDDWRFFPLTELNIPSQTTIKYQTGFYIGAPRCVQLAFKSEEVIQHFDTHRIFDNARSASKMEMDSQTEGKPHFTIKMYKNSNLLSIKETYMTRVVSLSRHEIDNKLTELSFLQGFWGPLPACYKLEPNSNYTIEVINNTPLAKFEGMAAFLVIRPNTPWLW